jgi:4-amino-4-deoxy-L-arabinose transferase-like glycosyltransferase
LTNPPQTKNSSLLPWSASLLILFFCLFGNLGAIGLLGPDEPRYVWIARAMAQTGDWVTPRLYGQPWFEKPILYYWLAAIGFLLHLPAEWAARLPSAFAALVAAVAIGWLASQFWKRDSPEATLASTPNILSPALFAPLLFATTVGAIGFSRAATPDMLFSAFIALAMACAADVLRTRNLLRSSASPRTTPHSDSFLLALFGAFLGFAVLAKGPAAIILAGGAIVLWAIASKQWLALLRFLHPYALASFCLIALPWYILCALRNPDFLRVFIFQHNFERYLTPVFQHPQPFWFFVPITLLALLPWTAALWPLAQEALRLWREKSWQASPGFFFACWAVFPVAFFSFSQSKLPSYILPAVAPLALLCAIALSHLIVSATSQRIRKITGFAIAATWLLLGISAAIWVHKMPLPEHEALRDPTVPAAFVAMIGAVAIAILATRPRGAAKVTSLSLALTTLLVLMAGLGILPRLDPYVSARWHAQLLRNDRHPDRIFLYHLPRAWGYGLAFYLGRELPEWSAGDPDPALVLTTPRGLAEIRQLHRFYGDLEENYQGILYVPIQPVPRSHSATKQ